MPGIARISTPNGAFDVLAPRLLGGESTSEGLSGTAIALIICVGVIPLCIVIWIVVWALFFYGSDRSCCCCRRRRNAPTHSLPEQIPTSNSTITTEEKRWSDYSINMPKRPVSTARIDSRHSTQSGSSKRSSDIEQVMVQEPKPFV